MEKFRIPCYQKSSQWRFWSDCANVQADPNLHWWQMSEITFSDIVALLLWELVRNALMKRFSWVPMTQVFIKKNMKNTKYFWLKRDSYLELHKAFRLNRLICVFTSIMKKHTYSNILKILPPKKWKFSDKNSSIFHISAQNIDCGYSSELPCWGSSNEYPQSMFLSRNKKTIMYTPVNPSFII